MKFIRRLTRHGHSTHVSIPPQLIDYLRLQNGDMIVVETTESFELRVRRAAPEDLTAQRSPLRIVPPVPEAARS
jgi:antitoxin component of MazEF toxin-antitoxin module